MEKKDRNICFDIMNILSCIAVIALHHNGLVHSFVDSRGWRQSLVIECGFYWAVPVFFMLSGINLMGYRSRYSTAVFLKKRALRTVFPWLFWSVVFLLSYSKYGIITIEPKTVKQAVYMILNNKVVTQYWFFGSLFACYLAVPVFSCLSQNRSVLWYVVVLNFLFLSSLPFFNRLISFSWSLDVPVVGSSSSLLFFILGYLLYTSPPPRNLRICLYILGFASVIFRFIYTLHFSVLHQMTDTSIKGYHAFHSVFYSCAVFLIFTQIPWCRIIPGKLQRIVPAISGCSFGIYLIHHAVMRLEMSVTGFTNGDWVWRVFFIPVTYFISLSIVYCIRKIPIARFTVGG